MIRLVRESDLPLIQSLCESEPGFWNASWTLETLRKAVQAAGDLALVYEDHEQILGFICAHDLGFRAYLNELIVAKQTRGKGIGKALVRTVERELARRGCPVLISDVWKDAVGFYESLGWSPPDVVLLRKRIT